MKVRYIFALSLAAFMVMSIGSVMAFDVAISTQANWWGQDAADKEMAALGDAITTAADVQLFPADKQAELADWVSAHTVKGAGHILILSGQCPDTIYKPGNAQADDSLIELFLDAGNTVLNTGDYMMYVVNSSGANGAGGLQTLMDIPAITMWDDNTPVKVTADGKKYTPSLKDFESDRPFHLDELEGGWEPLIVLAQNDAGTRADCLLVRNKDTGGIVGSFFQTASQDDDPRAAVMSELINSYYSTTPVSPASKLGSTWGEIKTR